MQTSINSNTDMDKQIEEIRAYDRAVKKAAYDQNNPELKAEARTLWEEALYPAINWRTDNEPIIDEISESDAEEVAIYLNRAREIAEKNNVQPDNEGVHWNNSTIVDQEFYDEISDSVEFNEIDKVVGIDRKGSGFTAALVSYLEDEVSLNDVTFCYQPSSKDETYWLEGRPNDSDSVLLIDDAMETSATKNNVEADLEGVNTTFAAKLEEPNPPMTNKRQKNLVL